MVNFGIWGNQWGMPGGTNRGGRQSAACKKLSKNPLKLRFIRQKQQKITKSQHNWIIYMIEIFNALKIVIKMGCYYKVWQN